jgi:hypothetical protein
MIRKEADSVDSCLRRRNTRELSWLLWALDWLCLLLNLLVRINPRCDSVNLIRGLLDWWFAQSGSFFWSSGHFWLQLRPLGLLGWSWLGSHSCCTLLQACQDSRVRNRQSRTGFRGNCTKTSWLCIEYWYKAARSINDPAHKHSTTCIETYFNQKAAR